MQKMEKERDTKPQCISAKNKPKEKCKSTRMEVTLSKE
jgi:hypothetical protein